MYLWYAYDICVCDTCKVPRVHLWYTCDMPLTLLWCAYEVPVIPVKYTCDTAVLSCNGPVKHFWCL